MLAVLVRTFQRAAGGDINSDVADRHHARQNMP
jgi:hypothetical protein